MLAEVASSDAVNAAMDEAVGGEVQVIADAKQGVEVLAVRLRHTADAVEVAEPVPVDLAEPAGPTA